MKEKNCCDKAEKANEKSQKAQKSQKKGSFVDRAESGEEKAH